MAEDTIVVQDQITHFKQDLEYFDNAAPFKAWLKTYKIPKCNRYHHIDDWFMEVMFGFR